MLFFRKDQVVIQPRSKHNISRKDIDPDALKVLYRLSDAGHTAYLVGGGVRDLLLGRKPKDFDISTDAHPNEIRRLFRNCFLIGRRFRLAHVTFGRKVIETSTFRKQPPAEAADEDVPGGLYQNSDNTFGTPEEDAKRRDFTVNGLFYDIKTFNVIDYVGGLKDLERRVLRCIGDPNIRFREDPVRMMRAVRFSSRLGLQMDWGTRRAIRRHYREIVHAAVPRVLEEIFRLFTQQSAAPAFRLLWETRMMETLLPEVHEYVASSGNGASPLWAYLASLDKLPDTQEASNGLRLATLYYPLFVQRVEEERARHSHVNHLHLAERLLEPLSKRMHVPRAVYYHAVHLLDVQQRLQQAPAGARRTRFGHAEVFEDAIRLVRVRQEATGEPSQHLEGWLRTHRESPHERRDHHPGRPRPQADDRDHGQPEATVEAAAGDVVEPGDPARRRRRRRRPRHGTRRPQPSPLSAADPGSEPAAAAPAAAPQEPAPTAG